MASQSTHIARNAKGTHQDVHSLKRVFIGPMLESDVTPIAAAITFTSNLENPEEGRGLRKFIHTHAKDFFLHRGGREEDWGDSAEDQELEIVLKSWITSEWGKVYRTLRRRKARSSKDPLGSGLNLQSWTKYKWVGSTFEVGDFMGVNVLAKTLSRSPQSQRTTSHISVLSRKTSHLSDFSSIPSPPPSPSPRPSSVQKTRPFEMPVSSTSNTSSYVTAKSTATPAIPSASTVHITSGNVLDEFSFPLPSNSTASNTPLLPRTPPQSTLHLPTGKSKFLQVSRADINRISPGIKSSHSVYFSLPDVSKARRDADRHGKNKAAAAENALSNGHVNTNQPAPPDAVLARVGSQINKASAGATIDSTQNDNDKREPLILQDRMIVRISLAMKGAIGPHFTEQESHSTHGILYRNVAEYLVVLRENRIELYRDYKLPLKELFLGHKRLAYVIPIASNTTQLSPFSPVDYSFCLTYSPQQLSHSQEKQLRRIYKSFTRKSITHVFILKPKTRSRAVDWMWHIWLELGGKLPSSLLVHNPMLENSVEIPLPAIFKNSDSKAYNMFTKTAVIDVCLQAFKAFPQWDDLCQLSLVDGKRFELCWRYHTNVDWVWLEHDVNGLRRDWAVLFGLALKIPRQPSYLELRVAEHYPTHIILSDGTYFFEPPAAEGYVYTIDFRNLRSLVYLTTHNNYLFNIRPSHAHPPDPPGAIAASVGAEEEDELDVVTGKRQLKELKRGREQIVSADGFADMRDVVIVRRASVNHGLEDDARPSTQVRSTRTSIVERLEKRFLVAETREPADEEDIGGDEYMSKVDDKPSLRSRRSIELVMRSGQILRFETHSCKAAIEWINCARRLIFYWSVRCLDDAAEEMDVVDTSNGQPFHPTMRHSEKSTYSPPPPDPAQSSEFLGRSWHWCVLEDCRPILKAGSIYVKMKFRAQYQTVQLFLFSDRLVCFYLSGISHHRRHRVDVISLLDMYVCSGHFAALSLPSGEYQIDAPPVAKLYRDGLETKGTYEDTFFTVFYRPHKVISDGSLDKTPGTKGQKSASIPSLSAPKKLLICRARSKLERDTWCWAVNCEIEKLVRNNRVREDRAREKGKLLNSESVSSLGHLL